MTLRLLALFVASLSLCAETNSTVPDIGALWAADWSAKKLDQVMSLYSPDARLLRNRRRPIRGRFHHPGFFPKDFGNQ
jgi:hypothetical protein